MILEPLYREFYKTRSVFDNILFILKNSFNNGHIFNEKYIEKVNEKLEDIRSVMSIIRDEYERAENDFQYQLQYLNDIKQKIEVIFYKLKQYYAEVHSLIEEYSQPHSSFWQSDEDLLKKCQDVKDAAKGVTTKIRKILRKTPDKEKQYKEDQIKANGFISTLKEARSLFAKPQWRDEIRDFEGLSRVYPINCVNFLEPLKSTIKFDYKMSHSFIPVRDRHGPFFGNIINR